MALDLNKVKSRLAQLQSKGKKNADGSFEKTDYTKIFWKPRKGEQVVRIVPQKTSPNYPILEVVFHNNIVKKKFLALTNFGEKDPIVEFSEQLRKSSDKEERDMGYKLSPKKRFYCQVLVRGEEHLGVRLWEFGPNVEKEILKLLNNKDYGDISDVNEGTDLTIEGVDSSFSDGSGKSISYIEPSITPARKESPLDKKEDVIRKYLEEQHDPLTLPMNRRYTYAEIKGFLAEWLGENEEADDEEEQAEPEVPVKDEIDEIMESENESEETSEDESPFIEEEGDDAETQDEEPPFEPDPVPEVVTKPKSAIAAASKKIIAKNNKEMEAKVEVKATPKIKAEKTEKAPTKAAATTVTKGASATGSNKEKFAKLFGGK